MILNTSSPDALDPLRRAVSAFATSQHSADQFVSADNTLAFVDVDRDEIVGWCWGYVLQRPDGTAMAYLHELEVVQAQRRRGVGTALVRAFAAEAASAGASKMFLTTGESNVPARRVYDAIGGALATQGPTVNYWFALPLR